MLEAKAVSKTYQVSDPARRWGKKELAAVSEVSLRVEEGRTLGVVGESGCGKSTLARLLTLLLDPDSGDVLFEGRSARKFSRADSKQFRRYVQIVFQDPLSSLDPKMRVAEILGEPFEIHREIRTADRRTAAGELLERVGLPSDFLGRFPHELSGGERQRISIARAIALGPKVLVCDEAVSSLDVLVQAEILNLLLKMQKENGLSYLFISHDMRIVHHMSDRVAVMKEGRIVEEGDAREVFSAPKHPYTKKLLESTRLNDLASQKGA